MTAKAQGTTGFTGFSKAAVDFYERLEADNTREFWVANKATYEREVRDAIQALVEELEPEFGPSKIFRPNRDIRFSADKSPYKTYQGAFAGTNAGTGFYVEVSARGLLAGGGFHAHSTQQSAKFRESIADDKSGPQLESTLKTLQDNGFDTEGEQVKTAPRGYSIDHPRIALLRYKELMVFRRFGSPKWIGTPRAFDEVASAWRAVRPLSDWIAQHVGPA